MELFKKEQLPFLWRAFVAVKLFQNGKDNYAMFPNALFDCGFMYTTPCSCTARTYGCGVCGCRCCGCSCKGCDLCFRNLEKLSESEMESFPLKKLFYEVVCVLEECRTFVPEFIQRINMEEYEGCNCANDNYSCSICANRACGPECSGGHPTCFFCYINISDIFRIYRVSIPDFLSEESVILDGDSISFEKLQTDLKPEKLSLTEVNKKVRWLNRKYNKLLKKQEKKSDSAE